VFQLVGTIGGSQSEALSRARLARAFSKGSKVPVNKPAGDKARKGAVKKRSQINQARRRDRVDQAQQEQR